MDIDNLTVGSFEELTKFFVNTHFAYSKATFYECKVKLSYYKKLTPKLIEITYSYNNPDPDEGCFIENLGLAIPLLKNYSSYNFLTVKIPYVEEPNYDFVIQSNFFGNKYLDFEAPHNFKITTDKILNHDKLPSASKPNSYTIKIEYF